MRTQALSHRQGCRAAVPSRRPRPVLAYLESGVSANVQDARKWIAAWRDRQAGLAAPGPSHTTAVRAARPKVGKKAAKEERFAVEPAPTTPATPIKGAVPELIVHAGAVPEVPANVQEARKWIAAWREHLDGVAAANSSEPPMVKGTAPEPVAHVSAAAGVPANVQEARNWIAAWKQRGAVVADVSSHEPLAAEVKPQVVEEDVLTAEEDVLKPKVAADGTIVFHKALLDSLSYEDVMKVLQQKALELRQ